MFPNQILKWEKFDSSPKNDTVKQKKFEVSSSIDLNHMIKNGFDVTTICPTFLNQKKRYRASRFLSLSSFPSPVNVT